MFIFIFIGGLCLPTTESYCAALEGREAYQWGRGQPQRTESSQDPFVEIGAPNGPKLGPSGAHMECCLGTEGREVLGHISEDGGGHRG